MVYGEDFNFYCEAMQDFEHQEVPFSEDDSACTVNNGLGRIRCQVREN